MVTWKGLKRSLMMWHRLSESGSRNWTEVRQFNLMFNTQLGNIAGEEGKLYLRPETAQGIFVNFLNVQKSTVRRFHSG